MQQVTAFSNPAAVPTVPRTARPNLWILNSWRDLILYVGTPLLLLPVFALAQARWSPMNIYLFVAAFGAMGHHLPGMIRAYGDRALFHRFRWRFTIAPLFLLVTCVAFYWWDLKGIILVVFFWGVWHGMMQTYGFCRIYDAKTGSFAALSRRLDFALCLTWFAAAIFLSTPRMGDTLGAYYASGGPFVPNWLLHLFQRSLTVGAIVVTVLFLANFIWGWTHQRRANPVKIALLATSITFWFYCNNLVSSLLVGIALFEVFHDVQYLSLVWIYNRNRVEKDSSIGGFMRFVFRRSGALIGLYLGLIFAYGSLAFFNSRIEANTIKRLLTGLVAASSLLHFYYDGFIWKMRESSTRQSLGISGGTAEILPRGILSGWFLHGAKWAAAFVLPLSALWFFQLHTSVPIATRQARLVQNLPANANAHFDYGGSLWKDQQIDAAAHEFQETIRLDPKNAEAHSALAVLWQGQSKFDAAAAEFKQSLALDPNSVDTHYDYSNTLTRLGQAEEANQHIDAALALNPQFAPALYQRAARLVAQNKLDQAVSDLRLAVAKDPGYSEAHLFLANLLIATEDYKTAQTEYRAVLGLEPKKAEAMNGLGVAFLRQGQISQAIACFDQALRVDPAFAPAEENLQLARASDRFSARRP